MFVEGCELIVSNAWLGSGMYFWDNSGQAQLCGNEAAFLDGSAKNSIVSADINLDQMLDLTDPGVVRMTESLVQWLADMIAARTERQPVLSELLTVAWALAERRFEECPQNVSELIQKVKRWIGSVSVVRAATLVERPCNAEVWLTRLLSPNMDTRPTLDCMTIYCVKQGSAVRCPDWEE